MKPHNRRHSRGLRSRSSPVPEDVVGGFEQEVAGGEGDEAEGEEDALVG